MIISKKLLIVVNVCGVIAVIGKVEQMISDFQRGKTFEGWGGCVVFTFNSRTCNISQCQIL